MITLLTQNYLPFEKNWYVTNNLNTIVDEIIEPKQEILDKQEKEYLSNVIKPFKKRVLRVIKHKSVSFSNKAFEYLSLIIKDETDCDLPTFEEGTMYKGMKLNKEYTLEELRFIGGIFMEIPRHIKTKWHRYIFVKKYPNFLLYQEEKGKYKECFLVQDVNNKENIIKSDYSTLGNPKKKK